ncbi:hypothetical protein [Methanobrevibacter sp.]|uniref:hypothetical protein n=1 Tax=Methanobrevibacter sp. TaxID=66852 RepID=UPI0026DEF86C|nr:hypothetical protein [Methanobrevibacter sp.]
MLVMLICCVSAVSATDADNITVPDDTDVIEIDDTVDSVEEVESDGIDDTVDGVNTQQNLRGANINGNPVSIYFGNDGVLLSTAGNTLTFGGDFYKANYNYKNFIINRAVTINANTTDAPTLHDMGFELIANGITLNGITFDMTAPSGESCYLIDIESANNVNVTNNKITYVCDVTNEDYYNYVIKVRDSENVTLYNNTITATLPLKDVDYSHWTPEPTIDYDLVSVVAVESCYRFKFVNNTVNVTINNRTGDYPTLSSILIVKSNNASLIGNKISVQDMVTGEEEANFLYAIDIYKCYNLTIDHNKIDINSNSGNLTINGTGAAYGIQLTGPHTGVMISYNNITTANNGPNLGIYSQNTIGETNLTIKGNIINVTGRAGYHPWALVSGMELQDTYATVCGNTIDVTNVEGATGGYIYGISYCQPTGGDHTYIICNNTVRVPDGEYAVYLDGVIDTVVTNNWLYSALDHGDGAVEVIGTNITDTGNFPYP